MSAHGQFGSFQGDLGLGGLFQGRPNQGFLGGLGASGSNTLLMSGGNPLLAAGIFGGSQLLSGLGGLIGGRSPLERLQEQLLQQRLNQSNISFGRQGEVFNQAGNLFGQPIIGQGRFNALFNRASQGEIARIGSSLQSTGIGNSSPIGAATFAFGTGGARARGMFDLLRQGANRDLSLLNLRGSLSRG